MINYMTAKVKFTKQMDNGSFKRVTESNLFASLSFSETEKRAYEELAAYAKGEFSVTSITRTELHDIFGYDDSDVWYKVKVSYDSIDADSEKSKKVAQNFLVSANSVREATDRVRESLSGLMVDFEITGVTKSPIVEVFPYKEILDREISRRAVTSSEVLS